MSLCIDTSTVTTDHIDTLTAAGVTQCVRYLTWINYWDGQSHTYPNPKLIEKPEYDALRAADIDPLLIWEFDARDWMSGATGAAEHAAEAVRQAEQLGYPTGAAIGTAGDFDVSAGAWPMCHAYLLQFGATVGAHGYQTLIYGSYDAIEWATRDGLGNFYWQAGMSWAWSAGRNGRPHARADLIQVRRVSWPGIEIDVNTIIRPVPGAFANQLPVPPPPPPPASEGFDMAHFSNLIDGNTGWEVKAVQAMLNAAGAHDSNGQVLAEDGIYGPLTASAVMNFQRAHGLAVDGIAGPHTRTTLNLGHDAP